MSRVHGASVVRNGLVLYLDAANIKSYSGSGTVWKDLTNYSTNFNIQNGTTFNSTEKSFITDGVNDMIIASNNTAISFTNQITISVWIKRISGAVQRIFNKYDTTVETSPFYLGIGSGDRLFFDISDGVNRNTIPNVFPTFGSGWNNFVCLYNGSNRYVYQNGNIIYSDSYSTAMINNTASYRIGSSVDAYTQSVTTSIMMYTRALSDSEVKQNFEVTRRRYGI